MMGQTPTARQISSDPAVKSPDAIKSESTKIIVQ